jgi:hypothetical protein
MTEAKIKKVESYVGKDGKLILKVDIQDILDNPDAILEYTPAGTEGNSYIVAQLGGRWKSEKVEGTPLSMTFSLFAGKDAVAKAKAEKQQAEYQQAKAVLDLVNSDPELLALLKAKLAK